MNEEKVKQKNEVEWLYCLGCLPYNLLFQPKHGGSLSKKSQSKAIGNSEETLGESLVFH